MEVIKCSRCGAFYMGDSPVCPKCINKDNLELSTFKNYIKENGVETSSLNQVSLSTGISEKNISRFLTYEGFEDYKKLFK